MEAPLPVVGQEAELPRLFVPSGAWDGDNATQRLPSWGARATLPVAPTLPGEGLRFPPRRSFFVTPTQRLLNRNLLVERRGIGSLCQIASSVPNSQSMETDERSGQSRKPKCRAAVHGSSGMTAYIRTGLADGSERINQASANTSCTRPASRLPAEPKPSTGAIQAPEPVPQHTGKAPTSINRIQGVSGT
jgi:hypothetical protein